MGACQALRGLWGPRPASRVPARSSLLALSSTSSGDHRVPPSAVFGRREARLPCLPRGTSPSVPAAAGPQATFLCLPIHPAHHSRQHRGDTVRVVALVLQAGPVVTEGRTGGTWSRLYLW